MEEELTINKFQEILQLAKEFSEASKIPSISSARREAQALRERLVQLSQDERNELKALFGLGRGDEGTWQAIHGSVKSQFGEAADEATYFIGKGQNLYRSLLVGISRRLGIEIAEKQ